MGGGAGRGGPGRLDKSEAEGKPGPRAVGIGGPAMSLVLLSLAALCWGAVTPEPVSPRLLPLPEFLSLEPNP